MGIIIDSVRRLYGKYYRQSVKRLY